MNMNLHHQYPIIVNFAYFSSNVRNSHRQNSRKFERFVQLWNSNEKMDSQSHVKFSVVYDIGIQFLKVRKVHHQIRTTSPSSLTEMS